MAGCNGRIGETESKVLLTPEEREALSMLALTEALAGFNKCPGCQMPVDVEQDRGVTAEALAAVKFSELPRGFEASDEAKRHYVRNRIRCPSDECRTVFCAECKVIPYHEGFTCAEFEGYQGAAQCRFCQVELTKENRVGTNSKTAPPLRDVCRAADCVERRATACQAVLPCGHWCRGVRGESKHLPCLEEECEAFKKSGMKEGGTELCGICWVEEVQASPAVRLDSCGHLFHHACVLKKVEGGPPSSRLTYGFLECSTCSTPMSISSSTKKLGKILSKYEAQKAQVQALASERLSVVKRMEGVPKELKDKTSTYYKKDDLYAMLRFCFYPCYKCGTPYYGGQKQCGAAVVAEQFDPKDLLCPSCCGAGTGKANCPKHGTKWATYKCRFCCKDAVWFCWGTTHFCDDCHKVAATVARKPVNKLPKCTCGRPHPPNGTEHCFGCTMCFADASLGDGKAKKKS